MILRIILIIAIKFLRRMVRLGGGHGSALPGLIIEKIDKNFLSSMLATLPQGVVVVTGTNGKTTTTHMLVHMLRATGHRTLTNASGSNLTRGLISTIVEHATLSGKLPYDIAVFELDEAFAPLFAKQVSLRVLIALNVMRDQLDRYGEIDTTANLIAAAATQAHALVINGNDSLLLRKTKDHPQRYLFGLTNDLLTVLSSESNLYGSETNKTEKEQDFAAKIVSIKTTNSATDFVVNIGKERLDGHLIMMGAHNVMNASAALLTTSILFSNSNTKKFISSLQKFHAAFGRGETLRVQGRDMTVALIKNPSGFTQNVATFVNPTIDAVLIVINDNYADGRDVSWLWDAKINGLKNFKGAIFVAGKRRYDMALRLKYENIIFTVVDDDSLAKVLSSLLKSSSWQKHLLIIPTYTAMLAVRKWIGAQKGSRHIW